MKDGSPIAKNHDFKPYAILVVIVFIGLRDAYYIKLVSRATAAIGLLSLRDTQSVPGKRPPICVNNGLHARISLLMFFLSMRSFPRRLPLEMFYRLGDINI